jgi:hypothetical protein
LWSICWSFTLSGENCGMKNVIRSSKTKKNIRTHTPKQMTALSFS